MSLNYKEVLKKAEEINKTLTCNDFIVGKIAKVIEFLHGDGTYCKFVSACSERIDIDWIAIYTEHHGVLVYHVEDLKWVREAIRSQSIYYNKEN